MVECNSSNIYPNSNDQQQFRLHKINEIKDHFVAEINYWAKGLANCFFGYLDRSLIVLSATNSSISITSFATVIGAPVVIASASFSLEFSISIGIMKKLLKATKKKKEKHNKIVMLASSKLNSIESKISEAFLNNEISHEDFMTVINEERNYRELKESIRMMSSQRSDAEKTNLIEEGKKISIDEVIKRNEFINNSLKSQTYALFL